MVSIFVVEDELMICEGLCSCFDWASLGARIVGSAADGRAALDAIPSLKPDIVLTDLMMPRMGGIELVQELRSRGWKGEVIFISAYQDVELIKKAFKVRAVDYIFKPIADDELLNVCRSAIQRIEEGRRERIITSLPVVDTDLDSRFLENIKNEVQSDLKMVNISSLAERLGMSRATLARTFRRITGESVADYISNLRIQTACGLLRNTTLKVYEIAGQVGYQDIRYFSRIFQRVMGKLPTEYRDMNHREKTMDDC